MTPEQRLEAALTAEEEALLRRTVDENPSGPFWTNEAMREVLATLDAERSREPGLHPHDGYAYEGCRCVCCSNVRALREAPPAVGEKRCHRCGEEPSAGIHDTIEICDETRGPCLDPARHHPYEAVR